jgi:hypothetical protein
MHQNIIRDERCLFRAPHLPRLNGLTTMTNSRFDGWRMEDVWLDK